MTARCLALLAGAIALGSIAAGAQAAPCATAASAQAGAAVQVARAALMAVPVGEGQTDVDAAAQRRIEAMKDRLHDFVGATMRCAAADADPAALQRQLAAQGDAFTPGPGGPWPDRHGNSLAYRVERVAGHPRLIAIVADLGIECGSDAMLMLYERRSAGWADIMVRRSAPYRQVSGAWGSFHFRVSPPDGRGRWYVATANINPWCTSAWQSVRWDLSRIGPRADRPRLFAHGRDTIYLGNDDLADMRAEPALFEIRNDGESIDNGRLVRKHVHRFAIDGDRVRRVPPVAENAGDFVDEWITSPWAEASSWSAAGATLRAAHQRLHDHHFQIDLEFTSIRSCRDGGDQIELAAQRGPDWFFRVRGRGAYRLERIAHRGWAACSGANRLDSTQG